MKIQKIKQSTAYIIELLKGTTCIDNILGNLCDLFPVISRLGGINEGDIFIDLDQIISFLVLVMSQKRI